MLEKYVYKTPLIPYYKITQHPHMLEVNSKQQNHRINCDLCKKVSQTNKQNVFIQSFYFSASNAT